MMSPAPIVSAGEAAGYYSNKDNYYFLGQLESEWLGEGAGRLGLEGKVRSDQLTAVLEGRLPDGSRLGKEINGNHTHRPGHDLTFSAPKSVSILALIGGDKALLEAHQHAVRVAAGYVEKLISARETVDGKTSIVHTGKMVAALYTHDTSRNLDPQLHTHMLVANMTELNGKWKALATDTIHNAGFIETVMKMQVTLGKLYRRALRERVEELGHSVEEVGPHGMWEISGVPSEVREEYSSRGREVRGAVGAEATLKSLDIAAKNTRKAKVDPSRLRLMERWQTQMKEKGWDMKAYQESVVPRTAPGGSSAHRAPEPSAPQKTMAGSDMPAAPEQTKGKARDDAPAQTRSGAEEKTVSPVTPSPRTDVIQRRDATVQEEAGARPEPEPRGGKEAEQKTADSDGKTQADRALSDNQPDRDDARPEPVPAENPVITVAGSPDVAREQAEPSEPAQPGVTEKAGSPVTHAGVAPLSTGSGPAGTPSGSQPGGQTAPAGVASVAAAPAEVTDAVRMAVSQLSDSKTRFTWGELLLSTAEFSDKIPPVSEMKAALDGALREGVIVPLDAEKGVFTSRIHLLDELSIQALSREHLSETRVVSFQRPAQYAPAALEGVEKDALVLMNAPKGVAGIRELTEQLAGISASHGREVQVLASSAERAVSLAKSDTLREHIMGRQQVLSGDFQLRPQSTLIVEGAERLSLKETLVLLGEARDKSAQLVFLDSAGRQANGNAMSVLESAGVVRSRRAEPSPGLEAEVVSIRDKRDRYSALADRFAELSAGTEPVTAIVVGQREQKHLTGLIRDALQNAGQLERDGVTVEARTPVWLDSKTRRMSGSYRAGQVLEDRTERETRHFVIDRVHEDTRVLSLIDSDGVLVRMKIADLTADWRLYQREHLPVAAGDRLIALAADRDAGLKSKDRLTVTQAAQEGITVERDGKVLTLPADRPLYLTHGYVAGPGNRDNDSGVVLAALNSRDITAQTMNSLAQSGHRAEIFTAEPEDKAEARLQRMRTENSPVQLVRKLSGRDQLDSALTTLHDSVKTDVTVAVERAIADQQSVTFDALHLAERAAEFYPDIAGVDREISHMVKKGDLIRVPGQATPLLVARATWEMEKAIIRVITEGKNTREPLMDKVDPALLAGLTSGQKGSALLVLGSRDQFTGIQGYAGVGKTTQVSAVKAAIDTLPASDRPLLYGLAPTHQAVRELRDVGLEAQTLKSWLVEHEQMVAAGEKPDYRNRVFLIDESSMLGNQDTAAAYLAIQAGGGRGVSMGDTDQFEAIESGAPFRLAQERSPMDVAIMKQIVRQKEVNLRDAVHDIIDNRIDAALQRLEKQPADNVERLDPSWKAPASGLAESADPVAAIVDDWISRTPAARERTLVIAQLNEDRESINNGIYAALEARGELGSEKIRVPVLEKIRHTRHEFNKLQAWQPGMVVKRGDAYQDVVAVDKNGSLISVRNESGRLAWYSPRELLTGDVELFNRRERELSAGTVVRFTATDRNRGQNANQKFTVEQVRPDGEVVLKGRDGQKTINPADVRSEQHIDYAWAITGYGSQGAGEDAVISLEGTKGGRAYMATRRAFYISVSRAKKHVQVYTDGLEKWVKAIKRQEFDFKTAHDALTPETERRQAKVIWAMGQPVGKTAIGRAWAKHEALGSHSLTARVIPSTKRFPEPSLALPLYDNNGKSAGLALVSLVNGDNGRLRRGAMRMVATQGASGAVVQRSRSGNTRVVSTVDAALKAVREHPEDGVVWQTGAEKPSPWMIKVSRGTESAEEQKRALSVPGESEIRVPDLKADTTSDEPEKRAVQQVVRETQDIRDTEALMAKRVPDADLQGEKPGTLSGVKPDGNILGEIIDERLQRQQERDNVVSRIPAPSDLQMAREAAEHAVSARVANEIAERGQQQEVRIPGDTVEKGRTVEHQEPAHTRTIQQKER
ncbi:conjugative relaxase (plasmid) [Kosakonia radicincitans]|uniref:MobF family relaxase n=1 Tax=Kosakonia radicincitans TaxID=283686 RepID=UPI0011EDC59A|nr:MobF family relaxase [Kosakonia radicincitans]QEM94328.1 conjugative relaxase [Kosakonia radicincitans]